MDDSKLIELFQEFRLKYPKLDYFSQEEIFQLGRMCFHLGFDAGNKNKFHSKTVTRSDGKSYESMADAGRKNGTTRMNISRAIKKEIKAAGYYWKIA